MCPDLTSKEFSVMQKFIQDQCGITIGEEKAYLIESRLSKLLIDSGLSSFEELYRKICSNSDPSTTEKVIDAITTNETLWFRDKIPWTVLEEKLLPVYISELREHKKNKIRIWSAACSTGQEPFSIAMSIDHYLFRHGISDIRLSDFEIIATDISSTVLQIARQAKFDSIAIMRGLDASYKDRYFKNEGRVWVLDDKIRNAVRFQHFNLQNSFLLLGKFDLIFCRYVMIYFSETLKKDVYNKMAQVLQPMGVFMVGSSELFSGYQLHFEMETFNNGVYYRLKE